MSDEIRIEMMRRKVDGTKATVSSPFVLYPVGDGTMEIVNAYDYFLQAFCEVRPYARTELSRLRDACKEFFEKHGARCFKQQSLGWAINRKNIKTNTGRAGKVVWCSLLGEMSHVESSINFIHSRQGHVYADELSYPQRGARNVPWKTKHVRVLGRDRCLILRETVPPPIVPDGSR